MADKSNQTFLGIDGGGTRCIAILADEAGRVLRRLEAGPANVKLLTDDQLIALFRSFARALPVPTAIGIGLAGAWDAVDTGRTNRAAHKVWPRVPCRATTDLEVALLAANKDRDASEGIAPVQVLIVSGTGSCAFGRNIHGHALKIGGWGHVLGDKGSAFQMGIQALRTVAETYDRAGDWPKLGEGLLRALQLNEPADLIRWAQSAGKADIAALAVEVFNSAGHGDVLAKAILKRTLVALTEKALICAKRLARPREQIDFFFSGSVLLKQPQFAKQLASNIRKARPGSRVTALQCESVWGAVEIARRLVKPDSNPTAAPGKSKLLAEGPVVRSKEMSPTERRNPRSMKLDKMSVSAAVRLMISEESRVSRALLAQHRSLEATVKAVAHAFRRGGRLFYAGAGTSGRLGVLDASECPVTFRSSPEIVQGIIAGGQPALFRPVEGAEDNREAAREAITYRGVNRKDVVLGIAASGTTPFVWGALGEAHRRGATTVLLCFNPYLDIPRVLRPDIVIAVDLGPEVLTGSTRLKAGTATKVALNIITTLSMVQIGKVVSNLMVDVIPSNIKLRDRAIRIVVELTGMDRKTAEAALQKNGWVIKKAIARPRRK